jgi:2-polyprenyl-3-methyl-5-hydroxy-6-metoxy-1,4-benzoquinol methylase
MVIRVIKIRTKRRKMRLDFPQKQVEQLKNHSGSYDL